MQTETDFPEKNTYIFDLTPKRCKKPKNGTLEIQSDSTEHVHSLLLQHQKLYTTIYKRKSPLGFLLDPSPLSSHNAPNRHNEKTSIKSVKIRDWIAATPTPERDTAVECVQATSQLHKEPSTPAAKATYLAPGPSKLNTI